MTFTARSWLAPDRPEFPATVEDPAERRAIKLELLIVFGITLGLSGVRSLLSLVDSLLQPVPLAQQQTQLNVPQAAASLIDLLKQLLSAAQLVGWGALGLYLLWRSGVNLRTRLGLDLRKPWADLGVGVALAAVIGIPGLIFYLVAVQIGINLTVAPVTVNDVWWRLPVLILAAIENGFLEEVLVVGYLLTRLDQLKVPAFAAIAISAVLRGSYHLYQGFGGFLGNAAMGVVFAWLFRRTRRLWPLVIAHSLLDIVVFVGYSALRGKVSWLP